MLHVCHWRQRQFCNGKYPSVCLARPFCRKKKILSVQSRLQMLQKSPGRAGENHPKFQGRGGLTKRAMQCLTKGARIASTAQQLMFVQQLRKDLRNGPAHVIGEHHNCNQQFCKHVSGSSSPHDLTNDIRSKGTSSMTSIVVIFKNSWISSSRMIQRMSRSVHQRRMSEMATRAP